MPAATAIAFGSDARSFAMGSRKQLAAIVLWTKEKTMNKSVVDQLTRLIRDVLRVASPTPGGGRALEIQPKDYYRLLELADEAGSINPSPGAPVDGEAGNHDEAEQLAHMKKGESNLARCYLELLARLRSTPKPKGDGEAGDLDLLERYFRQSDPAYDAQEMAAWNRIKARLSPAPKQGRECWVLWEASGEPSGLAGAAVPANYGRSSQTMRNGMRWVRMVEAGATGGEAGNGGDHA
jgi:hypothetical protein